MLASPRYTKLFRGVYLPAGDRLDLRQWVAAARLVLAPDARATGLTALRLRGLDFGHDQPLHFVTAGRGRTSHAGIQVETRRGEVLDGGVATPIEAFVEVCLRSPLLDAVQVGDRMIQRRLASAADFEPLRNHPRKRVATAARLVRPGAESVKETHVRLLCVLAGLPEPELQANISVNGQWVARVDMLVRAQGLILEFEGRQHLTDPDQWNRDIGRLDSLGDGGYRVVRITSEMLREPETLVLKIAAELKGRGWPGPPPRFGGLWRSTFIPAAGPVRRSAAA